MSGIPDNTDSWVRVWARVRVTGVGLVGYKDSGFRSEDELDSGLGPNPNPNSDPDPNTNSNPRNNASLTLTLD